MAIKPSSDPETSLDPKNWLLEEFNSDPVREGARLTKSGSHPGETNHQDAIQCKTGIAAQRGLPKETGCEREGKYASKAMTMAPVSNHREQSRVKGASAFDSGIWRKGEGLIKSEEGVSVVTDSKGGDNSSR
ncbi:hypothetical protein DSO57_1032698 [Entomophthora muscae]|uniref:Uncharacterized protein n=1 Tax=Entomophthora muscae TaxID=34485 RepID=A0ACC2SPX0_9FUNG|nr:hypothetical protein DSO57_1032698 [Entomophthora muscae]